jgi:hypothetical protein
MSKLIFGLLLIGMIVMFSFIAPQIYNVNKEFFRSRKIPCYR